MSTYNPTNVVNNIAYPAQATRTRSADASGYMAARATRDGSLYSLPWKQGLVLEGRCYHVTVGALTTPIVGGGNGTIIDLEQPEFFLSIPSGTSVIPLRIQVECKQPLAATDSDVVEILVAVDRTTADTTGVTGTAETAFNMRTDNAYTTLCTSKSACTVDITASPTLGLELARYIKTADMNGAPANAMWNDSTLLYEPAVAPVIVGPATLFVYWGGTVATSGYAQVEWAEFLTATDITA